MLLSGLLGAVLPASAGPGDVNVNVGGINRTQQGGGTGSDQGRRIEKPQTGLGSFSAVPDTNHRADNPLGAGGSLVPDTKSLIGDGTTIPSGNNGAFSPGSTTLGQPGGQFCSGSNVTIGEKTQSRFHCSNTVNGTFKP